MIGLDVVPSNTEDNSNVQKNPLKRHYGAAATDHKASTESMALI